MRSAYHDATANYLTELNPTLQLTPEQKEQSKGEYRLALLNALNRYAKGELQPHVDAKSAQADDRLAAIECIDILLEGGGPAAMTARELVELAEYYFYHINTCFANEPNARSEAYQRDIAPLLTAAYEKLQHPARPENSIHLIRHAERCIRKLAQESEPGIKPLLDLHFNFCRLLVKEKDHHIIIHMLSVYSSIYKRSTRRSSKFYDLCIQWILDVFPACSYDERVSIICAFVPKQFNHDVSIDRAFLYPRVHMHGLGAHLAVYLANRCDLLTREELCLYINEVVKFTRGINHDDIYLCHANFPIPQMQQELEVASNAVQCVKNIIFNQKDKKQMTRDTENGFTNILLAYQKKNKAWLHQLICKYEIGSYRVLDRISDDSPVYSNCRKKVKFFSCIFYLHLTNQQKTLDVQQQLWPFSSMYSGDLDDKHPFYSDGCSYDLHRIETPDKILLLVLLSYFENVFSQNYDMIKKIYSIDLLDLFIKFEPLWERCVAQISRFDKYDYYQKVLNERVNEINAYYKPKKAHLEAEVFCEWARENPTRGLRYRSSGGALECGIFPLVRGYLCTEETELKSSTHSAAHR